ncbi:MAG: BON domain-containing protein [Jatrophihabitantaceae bacterium]
MTLIQRGEAPVDYQAAAVADAVWTADRVGQPPRPRHLTAVPAGADQPRLTPRPDRDIAAEIDRYLRRGMQLDDTVVQVAVRDGVVTLTGELASQLLVHRLVEQSCAVSGVVSVSSQLTARYNDAIVPFAWGFPGR